MFILEVVVSMVIWYAIGLVAEAMMYNYWCKAYPSLREYEFKQDRREALLLACFGLIDLLAELVFLKVSSLKRIKLGFDWRFLRKEFEEG